MTDTHFNPPRIRMAGCEVVQTDVGPMLREVPPAPILATNRRPAPAWDERSRKLWLALIRQTKSRGDVKSALELEMILGGVPEAEQ